MLTDRTVYDEDTLGKVQAAITGQGIWGQPALDLITAIQNAGILFRERLPEGWIDKGPERTETDPDLMPPTRDEWRAGPTLPLHVRMAADADEARQEYESEEQDASGLAVPELTQAEEPVEQRISRAFANGWREGFERAQWGTRWDHS